MTDVGNVNVTLGLNSEEFIKAWSEADDKLKTLEKELNKSKKQFQEVSMAMAGTNKPSKELVNTYNKLEEKVRENQSAFDKFNNKLSKLDGGLTKNKQAVMLLQGALGKLVAGGALIALTKQFIDFNMKAVEAWRVQERALANLDNALYNSGVYTQQYSNHLKELSSTIQSYSNYGDEAVQKAIALGQSFSGNIKLTDELIKSVVDYAAATETDLQTAFTLVGKSIGTNTNALSRYGVKLDESMTKEEKMAAITQTFEQRFKGTAQTVSNSSIQLQNAIGDLNETWGRNIDAWVKNWQGGAIIIVKWAEKIIEKICIMKREISDLANDELASRMTKNTEQIARLDATLTRLQKKSAGYQDVQKRRAALVAENNLILQQIQYNKNLEQQRAKTSKTSYKPITTNNITSTSKGGTKTVQDKALEEYKKYIDEYNKLNDNYAATLQARQYVEGTLNIDPLTQQQEYDQLINLYTNYFAKITEISKSAAKNKAEILKLAETNLQDELQKIQTDKTLETQRKLYDIQKGYADTRKDIAIKNQAESELGGFIGRFSTGYQERLQLLQWYYKERERITDLHYDNLEEKQRAFNELEQTAISKNIEIEKDIWTKRGEELTSIFNQTFDSMLTNYGDFSENMQQLAINLSRYLVKEAFQSLITQMSLFKGSEGGILSAFTNIFNGANTMSNALFQTAESAAVANTSTQAMALTQQALAPLTSGISATMSATATQYSAAAVAAQQLAASIAQLAVSEAAYSVAKIPYIGGFLAPAAATLTGAAIAAATAMVAGVGKVSGLLGKVGGGISGSAISGGGGTALAMNTGIGPIARYDLSETLPKYHSGGLSTNEQLAILQRNERVLNPAETASYNGTQDDMSNAKVNNVMMFNIKAWDGKDVINTLKANSQTINQIVSSGIKNNQQGLRTTVQNL